MTREEAIANLNMISVAFVEPVTEEQRKLIDDTFEMAIKALDQDPCEDAISRQAVIDSLHSKFANGFDSDRWWNSMSVLYVINKIPPIKPQEKTGHWIETDKYESYWYRCSECCRGSDDITDYCPNCGARMEDKE